MCPDAKTRLAENTVLTAAVTAASAEQITIPAGEDIVVVAPSDAAFTAALTKLNLKAEAVLNNTALLTAILAVHIGAAANNDSTTATDVAGSNLMFMQDGAPISLADFQTASPASLTLMEGTNTASVEEVVACQGGATVVFVDTVLLPGTAPAPGAAPAPAPGPAPTPTKVTIGSLIGSVCPGIKNVLADSNFSTLVKFVSDPDIANTEITIPKGTVVIAAPTNAAFATYIGSVNAELLANKTVIAEILANHIAVAAAPSDDTATTLYGETMGFWTEMGGVGGNMAPTPTGIAALAATSKNGVITDSPADEMAKVVGSVACAAEGQYAFGIDTVLVPAKYDPAPVPAPAPGVAPTPGPVPSSGSVASMGLAAVAAMAAAILA